MTHILILLKLQHISWRKRNQMDTINDEDWSDMQQDFKYYLGGRDKIGRSGSFTFLAKIRI